MSLLEERADGVLTLTMNRPTVRNALSVQLLHDLTDALREAANNHATDRVVVLTGADQAFCSGADLSDPAWSAVEPTVRMRWLTGLCVALHELPQPTLAVVSGPAAGGGANLALGCDLVIASVSARFIQVFAQRGMVVDAGGSWWLPRLVGPMRAFELAVLGDAITGEEALRMGLANAVTSDAELSSTARAWALRLAAVPPAATAAIKRLLREGMTATFHQALLQEAVAQSQALAGPEVASAMEAWHQARAKSLSGDEANNAPDPSVACSVELCC